MGGSEVLDRFFGLKAQGTTIGREVMAGCTTFVAMAYIIFVNPQILAEAGLDEGAVFAATCIAAAIGSLIMGLYANYPIAVAPGMGLNAFFTYGVVVGMGLPWETALGAVFISGVIFIVLSLLPVREWVVNAIPRELKMAISAGIGLFLIIIGLRSMGIVADNPATLVGLGDLSSPVLVLGVLCFLAIGILESLKVPGGILIGMIGATIIAALFGLTDLNWVSSPPPSLAPTFLALDIAAAAELALATVIISFLFVDMFDTAGTLVGVASKANLLDEDGKLPRLNRALIADSSATLIGSLIGTSSVTSYVESAAGVRAGGRTGLTAVVVALLFLVSLFFAPLAQSVGAYATGAALVFVGCVMASGLSATDWDDVTNFVPVVVTAISMPLTYSIATGLGFGFVTYAVLKIGSGRFRELSGGVMVLAAVFLAKFIFIDAA